MAESVRSQQVVAVEFTPFPLEREDNKNARIPAAPRGLLALRLTRLLCWSLAFVRQGLSLLLRPSAAVLTRADSLWQTVGERVWRLAYSAGVLASGAAWSVRLTAVGLAGHLGALWCVLLTSFGRCLRKRVTVACLFSCACLFLIVNSFYALGLEVFLNGQSIGFASSPAEFARAVDNVARRAGEILNYPYYPNPDVTYRYAVVDRTSIFDQTEVEDQLFSQIADIKKLHVLTVDGHVVAVASDLTGLQEIVDGLLSAHDMDGQADAVSFARDVQITTQWTDAALERPLDEINALLTETTPARYDEVAPQETLADVASRNGMSQEDLLALNQGFSDGDQKLLVQKETPFLSVEARMNTQYEEEIPYTSVTVPDDTIYTGDTEVRVKGEPGVALVYAERCFLNGEEVDCVETSRQTILEPVQEVIAEGTKERPPKSPTGSFIQPYWGRLTSKFGYRSLFGGSLHAGIDLAGPIGSPIVAADGGDVIFAGVKSGYGNCVMISHGKGLVTLYGHCSKLLVTEGQAVAKGELIAKVGNTGRSTGPHLHFEIRVDGTAVNPLPYLND